MAGFIGSLINTAGKAAVAYDDQQRINDRQAIALKARQDQIAREVAAAQLAQQNRDQDRSDRLAEHQRAFLLAGGIPAHTETGETVAPLAAAASVTSDMPPLTLRQPGMPASMVSEESGVGDDNVGDTGRITRAMPAVTGKETPLPPMGGTPVARSPMPPPVMRKPDVAVPETYDVTRSPAYQRDQNDAQIRAAAAIAAAQARADTQAARDKERDAANVTRDARQHDYRMTERAAGKTAGETPIVTASRQQYRDTDQQELRAGRQVASLETEARAQLKRNEDAGLPLEKQRSASDSAAARQYALTMKDITAAKTRQRALGTRADSILNVIPGQRAGTIDAQGRPTAAKSGVLPQASQDEYNTAFDRAGGDPTKIPGELKKMGRS